MREILNTIKLIEKLKPYLLQIVIGLIILVGLLCSYSGFRNWLLRTLELDQLSFLMLYLTTTLSFIFIFIYKAGKRAGEANDKFEIISEAFNRKIQELNSSLDDKLFRNGTHGIYDEVIKDITTQTNLGQHVTIDILGYTLFSVSPRLTEWKAKAILKNITFNLYHLEHAYIVASQDIDQNWAVLLSGHLSEIKSFQEKNGNFLKENAVHIRIYPFAHLPAIHGFRMSNGCIYLSLANWETDSYKMTRPDTSSFYLRLSADDHSEIANELRLGKEGKK